MVKVPISRAGYVCQFIRSSKPSATTQIGRSVTKLTKIILKVADDTGDNFEQIEINLRDLLKRNLTTWGSTHIYDEPFFPRQKGHKRIVISLGPKTYEFSLVRVNTSKDKTLKDLQLSPKGRHR